MLAHFQDNEWWKITEHLTHLTASSPIQTDFRTPVHRYQNEIARLITMRNTASVKSVGQAAACSRCKRGRRDSVSSPKMEPHWSLPTSKLLLMHVLKGTKTKLHRFDTTTVSITVLLRLREFSFHQKVRLDTWIYYIHCLSEDQCSVYSISTSQTGCRAQIMALYILRCHYMGSCLDAWWESFLASLPLSVIDVHNVLSLSPERPGRKTLKLL